MRGSFGTALMPPHPNPLPEGEGEEQNEFCHSAACLVTPRRDVLLCSLVLVDGTFDTHSTLLVSWLA